MSYRLSKDGDVRRYAVVTPGGEPVCEVLRQGRESRWRSVLHLRTPTLNATITERSALGGLLRRVSDVIVPVHFDLTDDATGAVLARVNRERSLRDKRLATILDPRLDASVMAAVLVLLDAELFL
ncbi:hypothetical protein [Galactobacter valiniphilus]|uniref:hypothetical protein n=1 Tax=Galactobacter valiniphilus TaxID=2676122 RepID=UPI003736F3CC